MTMYLKRMLCTMALVLPATGLLAQDLEALSKVQEYHDKGDSLLAVEKSLPKGSYERAEVQRQRRQIFWRAATWQKIFFLSFDDTSSDDYLRQAVTLASYYEYADRDHDAMVWYLKCQGHPFYATALWQHGRTVREEVEERLSQLWKAISQLTASVHEGYSRKIPITFYDHISGEYISKEVVQPYSSLSESEKAEVVSRRTSTFRDDQAVDVGSRLLQGEGLSFSVSVADHLIVFGVEATQGEADLLAAKLEDQWANLTKMYFDHGESPLLLYVYANFNGGREDVGAAISRAVHFREKRYLEGYYEPLDYSIVLRKNIFFRGSQSEHIRDQDHVDQLVQQPLDPASTHGDVWYLGTPSHELVHALMYLDFPGAPLWLNEGMAALHEATDATGLRPIDNYRLTYVQLALERGKLPDLADLLNPDSSIWETAEMRRLVDAWARYFCIYLKGGAGEKDYLRLVYHRLRDAYEKSEYVPSDRVLPDVLGRTMEEVKQDFQAFIQTREPAEIDRYLRDSIEQYIEMLQ